MKIIVFLLCFSFLSTAMADAGKYSGVSQLLSTDKKVLLTPPVCNPKSCKGGDSELVVYYTLQGCLDDLAVSSKISRANGKVTVVLSALNLKNPDSLAALCQSMPVKEISVKLGEVRTSENIQIIEATDLLVLDE